MNIPVEVARAQGAHGVKGAVHGVKGAVHGVKGAVHGVKGGRPRLQLTDEERAQRKRDQQTAYRRRKGVPERMPGLGPGGSEYVRIWGKAPGEPLTAEEFALREPLWNARVERKRSVRHAAPVIAKPSVGRNEPCPCGSGRKFKICCGR